MSVSAYLFEINQIKWQPPEARERSYYYLFSSQLAVTAMKDLKMKEKPFIPLSLVYHD